MRVILLLLAACASGSVKVEDSRRPHRDDDTGEDTAGDTDDSGDTAETGDSAALLSCDELPGQQIQTTLLGGFDGSEDYAFDLEGWVVHVDDYGALVRENRDGDREVIATGLGIASGTRVLPDGSVVINSVERGAIQKITPDGTVTTLVSGLAYPNGLELGTDGFLYVAENGSDTVRRVDPETGENEVIGDGMIAPNGLSFDDAHDTLFVGSFGGGMVYAIDRLDDGTWAAPRVHGLLPGAELPEDDCADLAEGDGCLQSTGGYGTCEDGAGSLVCDYEPDEAACSGRAPGDTCETTVNGEPHTSVCVWDRATNTGDLWCSPVDADRIAACDGALPWGACTWEDEAGYCEPAWDGTLGCIGEIEYQQAWYAPCRDAAAGDDCVVADPLKPQAGVCMDYGSGPLVCYPPTLGGGGGFDGVTADSCGNVYATEYGPGIVWRWPAEAGGEPEELLDLRSTWIPNLHWGLGVGGWERTTVYIIKRTGGFVEVPVGVEGKVDALEILSAP